MASATLSIANISGAATSKLYIDRNTNATVTVGETSGKTVRLINVDNTLNTSEDVHLKLYDATAPTVGTNEPDTIIRCRKGERIEVAYTTGYVLGTGVSFAVTREAGKPAEVSTSTAPSAAAKVTVGVI